jgi:benzoyl-CoA 2,3-dioxygenase component A
MTIPHVLAPSSAEKPVLNLYDRKNTITVTVVSNDRITSKDVESDIHHIILDFGDNDFPVLEGQNIGIIPPGTNKRGRAHIARLYSIASARDGEWRDTNTLALTVKRVKYVENEETKTGLASDYVCNLEIGDVVQVTGPFGDTFLMPNCPEANIIMICTGTGAAPFRAMTERRRRLPDVPGQLKLYFGARTEGDLPYFDKLNKLCKKLINKQLVFSREAGKPKKYVQHHMLEEKGELAELLKSPETYVYICGLRDMELGVEAAFDEICSSTDLNWSELKEKMKKTGRYHVETY